MANPGIIRPYIPLLMNLQRLLDALICMGVFLGSTWYFGVHTADGEIQLIIIVIIFMVTLVSLHAVGVYRSWRFEPFSAEIRQLVCGCFIVFVVVLIIIYFVKVFSLFPRRLIFSWAITFPPLLIVERFVVRRFLKHQRQKGKNIRTCVIAGAGDLGLRLARWISSNPWSGTKVIGFFDDKIKAAVEGFPVLDNLEAIPAFVQQNNIDAVYLALPMRAESKIQRLVSDLGDSTASVYLLPDIFLFEVVLGAMVTSFGDLPIVALRETPFRGLDSLVKRAEDLVLAGILLVVSFPVMMVIGILIKFTSNGPVFLKQWRYGLNGKPFRVYKFRTMTVCEDGYVFTQATRGDPRVTPLGAFLRRSSLDELPQLINVLQGRMSMVGPRPHPIAMSEDVRKLVPGYMLRHKIRPGLTGLAQVHGLRGEIDSIDKMKQRIEYDLEYLRSWSFFLDLRIIFKTISAVFRFDAF